MPDILTAVTETRDDGGCSRPDQLFGAWAIEPMRFQRMFTLAKQADVVALRKEARKTRQEAAASGMEQPLYGVTPDGIALVEISGPMTKYETSFQSLIGGTSTVRTRQALRSAARNPEVVGVMVVFDSPGGTIAGTSDLAQEIRATDAKKPTYCYAQDLMGSAALFAGVAGRQVFANRGAQVGSIGAYAVVEDTSGVYAHEGVKVHVISSAPPIKGMGVEGTEITPPQLAEWGRQIKDMADVFVADVASYRGMTTEQAQGLHTGQVWVAEKARDLGLIDDVVSLDEAMRRLRSEAMEPKDLAAAQARADAAEKANEDLKKVAATATAEYTAMKDRLARFETEQRRVRFEGEAKELGLPAAMAVVLEKIEGAVGAETYGQLGEAFHAKAEQVKTGQLFSEKGTTAKPSASGGSTAAAKVSQLAGTKMRDSAGKLSLAEAQSQVFAEDPELYSQYISESTVRI